MATIIDEYLFFSDRITGDLVILDNEESWHMLDVLRIKIGSIVFVTDGIGHIYTCILENIEKKICKIRIHDKKIQEHSKPRMYFYIGIPEKDAFEIVLTELVPLGASKITPVTCTFCQKKWWTKKWEKHADRFRKKMITATKQSWNAWLPELSSPLDFENALEEKTGPCFFADANGIVLNDYSDVSGIPKEISCFVGPPGGFSLEEQAKLKASGAQEIKLSYHRLRTELAATVMASNVVQKFSVGE
jgi:16S rRNA (uracil1498-N3)-methyltransferase